MLSRINMAIKHLSLLLIAEFAVCVYGVLDLTCFSPTTRVNVGGNNGYFIGGYKSGQDKGAAVTFGRVVETGTTRQYDPLKLPTDSLSRNHNSLGSRAVILKMPLAGGVERVGVFYCQAEKGDVTEQITTIIMSSESVIVPALISQTVSVGDNLTMSVKVQKQINLFRWRQNGQLVNSWTNQTNINIKNVTVQTGGIYECHEDGNRTGYQAILQVIVRGCISSKWGSNCSHDCPICLNGGVCDDKTGICVCAPGFTGTNCQIVLGSNRWGQDGTLKCTSSFGKHSDVACRKPLFCLPHPYGCSCASGFYGIDCDQKCRQGFFGAGCKQECHCAPVETCRFDTGECKDNGKCKDGWSGVNCQQRCTEPATIKDFTTTFEGNILNVAWEPEESICLNKRYIVEIQLVNISSCANTTLDSETINTNSSPVNVPVKFDSAYAVYFTTILNGTNTNRSSGKLIQTPLSEPSAPPDNVTTTSVTTNNIGFQWTEPPCDKRNGPIISYHYTLTDDINAGAIVENSTVASTNVTIDNLVACTIYNFTIYALTEAGMGPPYSLLKTTQLTVPGVVSSFNVTAIDNPYELMATWKPSMENNCRETGYGIIVYLQEIDQCEAVKKSNSTYSINVSNNTMSSQKLTKLLPYSTYNITITTRNAAGIGKGISILQTTGIAEPSAPPENVTTTLLTTNRIGFQWTEPPCDKRNGPIISYHYTLTDDINSGAIVANSTVASTNVTIDKLVACTNYNLTIYALTEAGMGPPYSLLKTTQRTVPGAVSSFNVTSTDNPYELMATWQPSMENNCRETGYEITVQLQERDQCEGVKISNRTYSINVSNDNTMSSQLARLLPYSTYNITITTRNDAGIGKRFSLLQTTNKAAPTAPPSNVTVTSVTSSNISFEWSEPPCGYRHGPIVAYSYTLYDENIDGNDTFTGPINSVTISNLTSYTEYTFVISALTDAGEGPSYNLTQRTIDIAPTAPPSNITVTSVTSTTITFEWSKPISEQKHGPLSYSYSVYNDKGKTIVTSTVSDTIVMIDNLISYTNYTFVISASTDGGEGPSTNLTQRTNESKPSEPINVRFEKIKKMSLTVSWSKPTYPNGIITHYTVGQRIKDKPYDRDFNAAIDHEEQIVDVIDELHIDIMSLQPSTKYEFKVFAHTIIGPGPPVYRNVFTKPATIKDIPKPSDIYIPDESQITASTVVMRLSRSPAALVTSYQVGVQLVSTIMKRESLEFGHATDSPSMYVAAEFSEENIVDNFTFVVGDDKMYGQYWNPPLREDSSYKLHTGYVSEFNETSVIAWSDGYSVSTTKRNDTSTSVSPLVPVIVVLIILAVAAAILGFFVIKRKRRYKDKDADVINLTEQQQHDTSQSPSGNKNIAYEIEASVSPINPDASKLKQTASPKISPAKRAPPPIPVTSEAAATKQTPNPKPIFSDQFSKKPTSTPKPIQVESFPAYVEATKDGDYFRREYETLPGDSIHAWSAAKDPQNKKKNRYGNIITYDHSRVVLTPLENVSHSDYINASFIDGMYREKQYIASQGPNTKSTSDFWRMVWQYNVKKIVMLTNLVENAKIKCDKYWPEGATQYVDVTVTPTGEETFGEYVIRTFTIHPISGDEVRKVYQYHFTAWPDMGVPQAPSLLRFMKRVNSDISDKTSKTVVHCSAGVGRTGTYLTVKAMMEQAKQEGTVDVYSYVSKMRNNRMKMVQTLIQYQFIFDILVEALLCDETSIHKSFFQTEFENLKKINPKTKKTGLQEQFQTLEKITTFPKAKKCTGGYKEENVSKNRYPDIVPTDSSRPYLMTQIDSESTNYINAAYIDGTQMSKQHLVTQMPLPSTVADIWRMVYDYEFASIVMLNKLDHDDPSMMKYWPDKGDTLNFGPLVIKCTTEDTSVRDVIQRNFIVSKQNSKETRTVRQFSLQNWPSKDDKPNSPESVLALFECLHQWQNQSKNQRVTVHCINGVGVSCVFLAVMLILEHLDKDDDIDVFQAVRQLRLVRPQAVQNMAQFTFCYEAIQAHLDRSNGIYENYTRGQEQPQTADEDKDIYANVLT